MVAVCAQAVVVLFGVWILAVGALMLWRPFVVRRALAGMASTPALHFGEHALRFLVGVAFVFAADLSKAPTLFKIFGGFIAVSSVLIVLAPRRWHVRYAVFWADKLSPWLIRALSAPSVAFGAVLVWAAV